MNGKSLHGARLILVSVLISSLVGQVPGLAYAFTRADQSNIPARTRRIAPEARQPVYFLAWEGNRLVTTAGVFFIDQSVTVIDTAQSKNLKKGFKGRLPSVRFVYDNKQLRKVIIK